MNEIPRVNYRFSDIWDIRDFINPRLTTTFVGEGDKVVEDIALFIRGQFVYPLIGENPSADAKFQRFHKNLCRYYFSKYVYYMWSFPQETLAQKLGICIDTANLATSLLVSKIDAWCCLGEVRATKDGTLLGYHAWEKCPYKGELTIMETTVHQPANTLVTTKNAYDRNSTWAIVSGLYYVEQAKYNNKEFQGDSSVVASMNLPAKRVWLFGLEKTKLLPARKLYREWRREEQWKTKLLEEAYKVLK